MSLDVLRVDRAVNEYDELLRFGRNEDSGQWCVFRISRGNPPLPVLGFSELPDPETAVRRLANCDARRRGSEILDEINKHNDDLRRPFDDAAKEGADIAAEALEWGYRQMGKGKRVVVPIATRGNRMGGYS